MNDTRPDFSLQIVTRFTTFLPRPLFWDMYLFLTFWPKKKEFQELSQIHRPPPNKRVPNGPSLSHPEEAPYWREKSLANTTWTSRPDQLVYDSVCTWWKSEDGGMETPIEERKEAMMAVRASLSEGVRRR